MYKITPKETLFKNIREALLSPVENFTTREDFDLSTAHSKENSIEETFAKNFSGLGGTLLYCTNVKETVKSLNALGKAKNWSNNIFCKDEIVQQILQLAGLNFSNKDKDDFIKKIVCCTCSCLITQNGSVMFSSIDITAQAFTNAEYIVCFATTSQFVPNLSAAYKCMKEKHKDNFLPMLKTWAGNIVIKDIDGEGFECGDIKHFFLFLIDDK